jgi:hypothetical protein
VSNCPLSEGETSCFKAQWSQAKSSASAGEEINGIEESELIRGQPRQGEEGRAT